MSRYTLPVLEPSDEQFSVFSDFCSHWIPFARSYSVVLKLSLLSPRCVVSQRYSSIYIFTAYAALVFHLTCICVLHADDRKTHEFHSTHEKVCIVRLSTRATLHARISSIRIQGNGERTSDTETHTRMFRWYVNTTWHRAFTITLLAGGSSSGVAHQKTNRMPVLFIGLCTQSS